MVKLNLIKKPKRFCAIDASTNSLAFAIYEDKKIIACGKIKFEGVTTYDKVMDAAKKTKAFFDKFDFDTIIIEHTVFMNSPKTAAQLAMVQGALLGAASMSGVKKIGSVSPMTWQNFIGNKKLTKKKSMKCRRKIQESLHHGLKMRNEIFANKELLTLLI